MYTRSLTAPRSAFFLFGPRGTGKSTWTRQSLSDAYAVNLLPPEATIRYSTHPELLTAEVLAQPKTRWIVIDEVQRVPALLDQVHFLMEEKGHKRFALTGSSARKLKRGAANLLAGRAIVKNLFPLTAAELEFSVPAKDMLRFGTLPLSVTAEDDTAREAFLSAYVTTYLAEEIKAEALVRNLGSFGRFLQIAALAAGQVTNVSSIARDAEVSRDTARGYFEVLVDTLIGNWLPAFRPRARVKEVALPKFYWFDAGVLNATAGGFQQPLSNEWDGVLLEHLVHHELRAFMHYNNTRGSLGYWRTPTGTEVDFVWWYGNKQVAIEVKHGSRYRSEWRHGLAALGAQSNWVVYLGQQTLAADGAHVVPLEVFLQKLHRGEVLR